MWEVSVMPVDLRGKVALVAGGSRGIGAAIARRLAQAGESVTISFAHDADGAKRLVEALTAEGLAAQPGTRTTTIPRQRRLVSSPWHGRKFGSTFWSTRPPSEHPGAPGYYRTRCRAAGQRKIDCAAHGDQGGRTASGQDRRMRRVGLIDRRAEPGARGERVLRDQGRARRVDEVATRAWLQWRAGQYRGPRSYRFPYACACYA